MDRVNPAHRAGVSLLKSAATLSDLNNSLAQPKIQVDTDVIIFTIHVCLTA